MLRPARSLRSAPPTTMPTTSLLRTFVVLSLLSPLALAGIYQGQGGTYNLGTFGGHLPYAVKVIRVTNTVGVPIPVPFPVSKNVPFPISVPKPIPYAVPHPIPVEVTKPVVIQQPVPLEIPKPYAVPQYFNLKQVMSFPSEQLTVPQFHPGQVDFQAYLSYGNGNGGNSFGNGNNGNAENVDSNYGNGGEGYGNGNTGSSGYSTTESGYSQMNFNQEQSYNQQSYGSADQGYGGYSTQEGGNGYQTNGQGGYMMSVDQNYPQGGNGYSQATGYGVMLGQNFETTNNIEDSRQGSYK